MKHGSNSGYSNGCRCTECVQYHSTYNYDRRKRRIADAKVGLVKVPHGSRTGYADYGCRCELCSGAQREYARAYNEGRKARGYERPTRAVVRKVKAKVYNTQNRTDEWIVG